MWARKCQECGHIQAATQPKSGASTQSYLNSKCRRCHSEALDYGHDGYERNTAGKIVRKPVPDDDEY